MCNEKSIITAAVIVKLKNGKTYQVLLTNEKIKSLISYLGMSYFPGGNIRLLDTELNIDISDK